MPRCAEVGTDPLRADAKHLLREPLWQQSPGVRFHLIPEKGGEVALSKGQPTQLTFLMHRPVDAVVLNLMIVRKACRAAKQKKGVAVTDCSGSN